MRATSVATVFPRLVALCLDAHDPDRLARFWATLLGRRVVPDPHGPLLPGDETQVGLRFLPSRAEAVLPDRVHLHLTSGSDAAQHATVEAALSLGARHLHVGQLPEEEHVVLADPERNAFCVIEAGNDFLAGCGFLGELACDGSRQVGLFWSEALGWPLVWDRDEETAVQSPLGGTKVAWGGPPLAHRPGGVREQAFEVAPADGDQAALVDRLLGLGATRVGRAAGGVVLLADPDGGTFRVLPG